MLYNSRNVIFTEKAYICNLYFKFTANNNNENKMNQFLGASMDSDGERFVVNIVISTSTYFI